MRPRRTLSLKREELTDLTAGDLRAVVGGIMTEYRTQCLTPILIPADWTYPCSNDC